MNHKMKLTGLILAGYMLGRTKKLGMALTIASTVAGTTAVKNRESLIGGLKEITDASPELKELQDKITGRLADSGKGAAKALATKGIDELSSRLQERTEKMKSSLDEAADDLDPSVDDGEDPENEDAEADAPEDLDARLEAFFTLVDAGP